VCSITIVFGIVRAAYLLCPPYTFTDHPILLYCVFELPTFLFYTIYTIILYMWILVILRAMYLRGAEYDSLQPKNSFSNHNT